MEYKIILATIIVATIMSLGTMGNVLAKSSSSGQVGYSDGVADCSLGYHYYIDQHSNAGSHSAAYMNAYNMGYVSCNNAPHVTTNVDDHTIQTQGQSATQQTTCIIAIGSCGAPTVGQSANQQH